MKTNIEILQDYVNGVRPVSVFGYTPISIRRNIGDVWEDVNGITWKQENGYKKKINKQADIIKEIINLKCKKCNIEIKWGSRLDKYFFNRTGMCENCLIEYETKLRIAGVYDYYEQYKLLSYEIGNLKDVKIKLKEIIKYFSENSGDLEMICNSSGFIEKWKNINQDQIIRDAKNDLKFIRRKITSLTKLKDDAKIKYIDGAEKFKLETYV
jgi:hypothetical protein